ncbi:hypothetical protein BC826DRAFT_694439 [Russula brevipes]|nr:hypothetical protein BC826DRAFT_694439 [Russula brevipes]
MTVLLPFDWALMRLVGDTRIFEPPPQNVTGQQSRFFPQIYPHGLALVLSPHWIPFGPNPLPPTLVLGRQRHSAVCQCLIPQHRISKAQSRVHFRWHTYRDPSIASASIALRTCPVHHRQAKNEFDDSSYSCPPVAQVPLINMKAVQTSAENPP